MKFTVLLKYCEGTEKWFKTYAGGKLASGIKYVRLDKVDIVDKTTGEFCKHAYAVRCKTSVFNLLRSKKEWNGTTWLMGWKWKT